MLWLGEITLKANDIKAPGVSLDSGISTIVNILLFIAGTASVVFIILSGIRYIMSQGNQDAVNDAKNTLMYAVIGLIITILAYAIVRYILNHV